MELELTSKRWNDPCAICREVRAYHDGPDAAAEGDRSGAEPFLSDHYFAEPATTCARCHDTIHADQFGTLIDPTGGDVCAVEGDNRPHIEDRCVTCGTADVFPDGLDAGLCQGCALRRFPVGDRYSNDWHQEYGR